MTSTLTNDSIVVDLGFNEGAFATEMARRFGCRVFATEPLPSLLHAASPFPGVDVAGVAVAGVAGVMLLHDNPTSCATIEASLAQDGATAIPVEAVTLETFLSRVPGEVAVLKIDIEGAELGVLLNTPRHTLARVQQLTVEFHDFLDPSSEAQVRLVYARLERLSFSRVRFARGNDDVLFIRSDLLPVPLLARMWLAGRYKYPWGFARILRRCLFRRRALSTPAA